MGVASLVGEGPAAHQVRRSTSGGAIGSRTLAWSRVRLYKIMDSQLSNHWYWLWAAGSLIMGIIIDNWSAQRCQIRKKSRQIRGKIASNSENSLCRVNSVEYICPFALKMFLVIENHFGGAFEGGDLAKVCKFRSILCKIRDGWLRAGRAL